MGFFGSSRQCVLSQPGGRTPIPQRLGTTVQSSWRLGRIANLRPTTDATETRADTAGKSSGQHARSAMSLIQDRKGSGTNLSSRIGTGRRSTEIGDTWGKEPTKPTELVASTELTPPEGSSAPDDVALISGLFPPFPLGGLLCQLIKL